MTSMRAATPRSAAVASEERRLQRLAQANSTGRTAVFALVCNRVPWGNFGDGSTFGTLAARVGGIGCGLGREARAGEWIVEEFTNPTGSLPFLTTTGIYKPMRYYPFVRTGMVDDGSGGAVASNSLKEPGSRLRWRLDGLAPRATRASVAFGYAGHTTGLARITAVTTAGRPIPLNRIATAGQMVTAGLLSSLGGLQPDDRVVSTCLPHIQRLASQNGQRVCIFDGDIAYDLGEIAIECVGLAPEGAVGTAVYAAGVGVGQPSTSELDPGVELQLTRRLNGGPDGSANETVTAHVYAAGHGTEAALLGGGHGGEVARSVTVTVDEEEVPLALPVARWSKTGTRVTLVLNRPARSPLLREGQRVTVSGIPGADMEGAVIAFAAPDAITYGHTTSGNQPLVGVDGGLVVPHGTAIGGTVRLLINSGLRLQAYDKARTDVAELTVLARQTRESLTLQWQLTALVDLVFRPQSYSALFSQWGDRGIMDGFHVGPTVWRDLGGDPALPYPANRQREELKGQKRGFAVYLSQAGIGRSVVFAGGTWEDDDFVAFLQDRAGGAFQISVDKAYLRRRDGDYLVPAGTRLDGEVVRYTVTDAAPDDPLWATG